MSPRNARITDDVACRDGDQAGIDTSVDELRDRLRRRELSTDVDALLTEFYKQLRETVADDPAVKAAIGEADVADRWDAIATELDELEEVSFADEETAVVEITAAMERPLAIVPATNLAADRRLRQAVDGVGASTAEPILDGIAADEA